MIDSTPTTLYRLFAADGTLLYVGIAGNPGRRWEQHAGLKPWWGDVARTTLEHFPSRVQAAEAELKAIRAERPRYNVVGNAGKGQASPVRSQPEVGNSWKWANKRSGGQFTQPLELQWELNGSGLTDDYYPTEMTAFALWDRWLELVEERGTWDEQLGRPWVTIFWFVTPCYESAPFQRSLPLDEDFLTFFSWPRHAVTGERVNWNRLPIPDVRWTPDQADRGGFIQEVTGWKPAPLQPAVDVAVLARAAGMGYPS